MDVIKKKDWFKIKRYPHIGLPLDSRDRFKWIEPYVTNPEKVASHSFLPFIHKTSKIKIFRKDYSNIDGSMNWHTSEKLGSCWFYGFCAIE